MIIWMLGMAMIGYSLNKAMIPPQAGRVMTIFLAGMGMMS